jgi:hypothetical protein
VSRNCGLLQGRALQVYLKNYRFDPETGAKVETDEPVVRIRSSAVAVASGRTSIAGSKPGRAGTHDYKRHGTTTLFALHEHGSEPVLFRLAEDEIICSCPITPADPNQNLLRLSDRRPVPLRGQLLRELQERGS